MRLSEARVLENYIDDVLSVMIRDNDFEVRLDEVNFVIRLLNRLPLYYAKSAYGGSEIRFCMSLKVGHVAAWLERNVPNEILWSDNIDILTLNKLKRKYGERREEKHHD